MLLVVLLVATLETTFLVDCLQIIPNEPSTNCSKSLDNLANALANFTLCSVKYSKPIKLCEKCVYNYLEVLESYQDIARLADGDHSCISNFVNLDRLQIVDTLYKNSYDLWNQAKCYECYQSMNGNLTANLSLETKHFNELLGDFKSCISGKDVNETNMCNICIDAYTSVDKFYKSISNENEKIGVCMDIVDMMNQTRGLWSKNCCKYRHQVEYIFVFSTAAMLSITIMFYVLTKICTDKTTPTVFKQSRFANYLQNSSSSSRR